MPQGWKSWVAVVGAAFVVWLYVPPIGTDLSLPHLASFLDPGVRHAPSRGTIGTDRYPAPTASRVEMQELRALSLALPACRAASRTW